MSRFIGNFPVVSAVIIILFGILVILIDIRYLEQPNTITTSQFSFSYWYFILPHYNYIDDSSIWFWAIIFIIPFVIHTGYIVYKDELYQENRKVHYLWIIISYGISYLITQLSLYGKIDANEIEPIDILSVNTFFIIMWLLAQAAFGISYSYAVRYL